MQCRSANFCNLASEGPDIIMHQLKSSYNSPFKDSYSDPIHTRFAMIASNGGRHYPPPPQHVDGQSRLKHYIPATLFARGN